VWVERVTGESEQWEWVEAMGGGFVCLFVCFCFWYDEILDAGYGLQGASYRGSARVDTEGEEMGKYGGNIRRGNTEGVRENAEVILVVRLVYQSRLCLVTNAGRCYRSGTRKRKTRPIGSCQR